MTILQANEVARVENLARYYDVRSEEMIARLFQAGLLAVEKQAREARERDEKNGDAS